MRMSVLVGLFPERQRYNKIFYIWSTSHMSAISQAGPGQSQGRGTQPMCAWQGLKPWTHHLLPPRADVSRYIKSERVLRLESRQPIWDVGILGGILRVFSESFLLRVKRLPGSSSAVFLGISLAQAMQSFPVSCWPEEKGLSAWAPVILGADPGQSSWLLAFASPKSGCYSHMGRK